MQPKRVRGSIIFPTENQRKSFRKLGEKTYKTVNATEPAEQNFEQEAEDQLFRETPVADQQPRKRKTSDTAEQITVASPSPPTQTPASRSRTLTSATRGRALSRPRGTPQYNVASHFHNQFSSLDAEDAMHTDPEL